MFFIAFILFILPVSLVLSGLWGFTGNRFYIKALKGFWLFLVGFYALGMTIQFFTATKELSKKDYYGNYVVYRYGYKSKQADWQYNHFRFEIKENDSIYFYETEKQKILKTYRGTITTTDPTQHASDRLIIHMEQPTHHILTSNPTTYRFGRRFYLVFDSPKFYNVFFWKEDWKPLE